MNNKLLAVIITLVVGVILAGSLLVPVINDYSTATKTIENEGMPYAAASGEHTIIVTSDGITYDGVPVDVSKFPGSFGSYTLVYGEKSFIRWASSTVLTVSDDDGLHQISIQDKTITISLNGSSVNVTISGSAQTFTADDVLYHISPSGGDYVLALNPYASTNDKVYAAGDSFFASGDSRPGTIRLWIVWTGEVEDITIDAYGYTGTSFSGVSIDDTPTVNITNPVSNLYQYQSVVFDWTASATVEEVTTDYPLQTTYTYFLAPHIVSYDNPGYIGAGSAGILAAIPVLVIVALLIVAVGMVARKNE